MRNRGLRRIWLDLKRHPWIHLFTLITVTLSLFLLGAFFAGYRNFEAIAHKTNPSVTGTLYLRENVAPERAGSLQAQIGLLPGVARATFKGRAEVADELQSFLGAVSTDSLPAGNLFPDVVEVELKNGLTFNQVTSVKESLKAIPDIAEVDFSEDWLAQYRRARDFLNTFGAVLLLGLIVGCSFIIANFMGMRHQARREEIEVVRLMGAHSRFVLAPFLWEGLIEGVIGASLALILLLIVQMGLSHLMTHQWSSLLGLRQVLYLSLPQIGSVVGIGILMAVLGSFTVFLRFRSS